MINFHPTREMLASHSSADLPVSLAVAVSAHIEMCPVCQALQSNILEQQAADSWQLGSQQDEVNEKNNNDAMFDTMFEGMFEQIVSHQPQLERSKPIVAAQTSVAGRTYKLPIAFRSFNQLKWAGLGAVSRARVNNDDGKVRSNLLHIDKNGVIPQHKHKGYELTLLLDGSFEDENGVYNKGDFIWLNSEDKHTPFTKEGCLCYTVQDAPLHFVSGISKVLNPLGSLIY